MKKNVIHIAVTLTALIAVLSLGLSTVIYRARSCWSLTEDAALAAGQLSFVNGAILATEPPAVKVSKPLAQSAVPTEAPTVVAKTRHAGERHEVAETNIASGNLSYDNVSWQNNTPYDPDIGAILSGDLPFELEDNHTVQVLIYHTHTCESYLTEDTGYYYDDFYPRSTDGSQGVVAVGESIADMLKARGIGVVHDTTIHDYPSYEGSYARSWDTISAYQEKYPGIKVTLDIHRDSMTTDVGVKYKPTFTYQGKKAAQIMIMTGYDDSGDFSFWDENLVFAAKLQKRCEDMYPGMTRPLDFGEFTYNMNFNNGSLLIEVGTDANTVEEAVRSGEFLGNALSSVLQKG